MEFRIDLIITVVIAVAGWITTHILNNKANEKKFLNNIKNDARIEIVKAIRDYQNWLSGVSRRISELRIALISIKNNLPVNWIQITTDNSRLFFNDRRMNDWNLLLEENQILFPKTAKCREELQDIQLNIFNYTKDLQSSLQKEIAMAYISNRNRNTANPEFIKWLEDTVENAERYKELYNMQALMEDLRIYLQNYCLSAVTGEKVPKRIPKNKLLPRIIENYEGNLIINRE
ncbi:hypothetical protein ACFL6I_11965 [candidate division KSB1 bacterium]